MKHWEEYWKTTIKPPIVINPPVDLYGGTNYEPDASIGMSCFLDPARDKFKDGFSILDYGCGAGILANFISARLDDFNYYGIEPDSHWGPTRIDYGKNIYGDDSRIFLGFINHDFNSIIKNRLDLIVLISVFTHLPLESIKDTLRVLNRAWEFNPQVPIVFSCFISNKTSVGAHLGHIHPDYYSTTQISETDLYEAINECMDGAEIEKVMDFVAMGGYIHNIYSLKKQ